MFKVKNIKNRVSAKITQNSLFFKFSEKNESKKEAPKIKESFDNAGRIKELKYYKSNKLVSINKYKYDNSGNEIEHTYIQKNDPESNSKKHVLFTINKTNV